MRKLLCAILAVGLLASGAWAQTTHYVSPGDDIYDTVANVAVAGDIIEFATGTYTFANQLNITKALTLRGVDETNVIFDMSGSGGYGISVAAGDVTLEYFTMLPPTPNFPIHASGTSNPPNGFDNLTIQYVTITGAHQRTAFDIHGYNNVVLSHLTAGDATGGNGVQVTGCVGVTMDNITTFNNAWGSIAIYSSNGTSYLGRGSDDVTIYGDTCSLGEGNIYNQDEFGLVNTDIVVDGYEYMVVNEAALPGYDLFRDTLADATTTALAIGLPGTVILSLTGGPIEVVAGLLIQDAIDAADPGDTILVGAGTYNEQINLNKFVKIDGAGSGADPLSNTIITGGSPQVIAMGASGASSLDPVLLKDVRVETTSYAINFTGTLTQHVRLENVSAQGADPTDDTESNVGIKVSTLASVDDLQVVGCNFDHFSYGWYFAKHGDWGPGGSNVTNVTVENSTFNYNQAKGLYVEKLSDASFTGCSVLNNGQDSGFWNGPWNGGFDINLKGEETYQNLSFIGCTFQNNGLNAKEGVGLTVKGRDDGTTYGAHPAYVDGVVISDCIVTGNERGIRLGEPGKNNLSPTNTVISGCTLSGNVQTYGGSDGSDYGDLVNMSTAAVDAGLNWWGDTDPSDQVAGSGPIDFSPWLGFAPGTAPMTWHVSEDLQEGIDAASSGDTIELAATMIDLPTQVIVDKDLSILGDGCGATTLAAGFSPSGGSYSETSSLIQVDYGVTATLQGFTLDGSGFNVRQGIQSRAADLSVIDCCFSNLVSTGYDGRGIVFLTGDGLVQDCTMTNIGRIGVHIRGSATPPDPFPTVAVTGLDYTGKGDGDWLDYGVEFGGGGAGTVDASTVNGCTGVAVSDGSTSAGILVTDYYGGGTAADITGSDLTGNTTGVVVGYAAVDMSQCTVHGCDLSGNASYGVSSTGVEVDALGNWWGAASGPYNATLNPLGTGVHVSDNVLFDPWTGMGTLTVVPASSGPLQCGDTLTLTVHYEPGSPMTPLRGYNITLAPSPELEIVIPTPGNAFSAVTFTDVLDLLSPNGHFPRVIDNEDGTLTVDNAILGTTDGLETGANLFSFTVSTEYEGTGLLDLITVTLRDVDNANIGATAAGAAVEVDCTAPPAAFDMTAAPGGNEVRLSWDIDDPDSDVDHFELWRAVWHTGDNTTSAYPEYDDVYGPVLRKDNYAGVTGSLEWTQVTDAIAFDATSYNDAGAPRGIYWYELFAVDAVGNVGLRADNYVRATNYFLGDFQIPAGAPGPEDISWFGSAYGTIQNTGDTYADTDIGPTDDFTGLGIPTTDNVIGFEDLMIIALNYQNVSKQDDIAVPATIALNWTRLDQDTWALELNEPCEGLLGLNVRAPLPEGVSVTVERGELLDQQGTPAFLATAPDGLDIGVAALGQGFTGQGELLRVTAAGVEELSPAIDARGHDNAAIDVALTTSAADLPSVLALNQNHPNPFNPSTTIKFDLPQRGRVDLKIYALDGSLVRTLVSEVMDPGRHDVIWLGRDDTGRQAASGTYFYRMVADGKTLVRKMTLMK